MASSTVNLVWTLGKAQHCWDQRKTSCQTLEADLSNLLKQHFSACLMGPTPASNATSHDIWPKTAPTLPGLVFTMSQEQAEEDPNMIRGIMNINSLLAYTFVDLGSPHTLNQALSLPNYKSNPVTLPIPTASLYPLMKNSKQTNNSKIMISRYI